MNWTGGRLHRHSTGNCDAAAKQKQYFAKIQQNLRGGIKKKSPMKWTIFNHVVEQRKLSGIEPTLYYRKRSNSVRSNRGSPQPTPDLPSRCEINQIRRINDPQHLPPELVQHRRSPAEIDNLYDATPTRPVKREASVVLRDIEEFEELDEAISEKRRRLLRKVDWVGISIQKPVGVKFVASTVEENVGRRKKLTDGNRARYQSKQSHITSPFADKRRHLLSSSRGESRPLEQKTDVRIRIGGKVVPPGISSSSVVVRDGSQLASDYRRPFTESSDVMLLDGGDGPRSCASQIHGRDTPDSPASPVENWQSSILNNTTDVKKARKTERHERKPTQLEENSRTKSENRIISIQRDPTIALKPLRHHHREMLPHNHKGTVGRSSMYKNPTEVPKAADSGTNSPHTESHGEELLQEFGSSKCETYFNKEGETVFSSRPSSIHHPVPQSSRKSTLLPSDSPERDCSTLCHIGELKPVVPRSQMSENEIRATWIALAPESDEKQALYLDSKSREKGQNRTISPGISTIIAARKMSRMSHDDKQSSPLEGPNPEDYRQPTFANISEHYTKQNQDKNYHNHEFIRSKKLRGPANTPFNQSNNRTKDHSARATRRY